MSVAMKSPASLEEREALARTLRDAYMEIFPTATIEAKLDVLQPGSYVAVTCSPSKGIEETLEMSQRLAHRGFKVVPHIAARMVRDKAHLQEIMARLHDMPIESLFVPGGDSPQSAGIYSSAYEMLRDMADCEHRIVKLGVGAHPEGHPAVSDEVLMEELLKKQEFATYFVTQMCFDADIIGTWIKKVRACGVTIPAWLGLPSVSQRASLMKTSLRIGVGNSLRYLKNHGKIAAKLMMKKEYRPDDLLIELGPYLADPNCNIEGHHIYCFNAVETAEEWRVGFLEQL
jgi:methylenetetrahydrofolate reductase (NADPH)